MDLIFFGMQGSGKGTLGKAVAEKFNMKIFEMGGELRKLSQEESELGKKVKSIIEAGHLVSNEVVMEIVENFINHLGEGVNVLFDGIPRTLEQAKNLNALLGKHSRKYYGVLLDIAQDTAMKRLTTRRICKVCKAVYPADYKDNACKCGGELVTRSDDNPEAIKTRLEAFQKETVPAIELYKDHLLKLDGEGVIAEVEKDALEKLPAILNQ